MSEPVHVLHVVGNMGVGGYETLIMNIYRNIDRTKVQFDFLIHTENDGEYAEEIKSLGGRLFHMPVLIQKPKVYYWRLFKYIHALNVFFDSHKEISIVHGHMTNTASIYMPIASKHNNIKACISHSHQSEATPGLQGKVTNILQKNISKVATDYFACSEKAAEWIYPKEIITDGRVNIINNGIDTSRFNYSKDKRHSTRLELGIGDKLVIGNVARFKKVKNHKFIIEVFNEVHKIYPNSVLVLVGVGELLSYIKEQVCNYDLEDSVLFLGGRSDVAELMNAFDIFLLPSLNEGLPLVGIEAQSTGLPVFTSTDVSRETDVTGNVKFLSLDLSAHQWAEEILKTYKLYERTDLSEVIKSKGYDIRSTANWLQNYYLSKALEK